MDFLAKRTEIELVIATWPSTKIKQVFFALQGSFIPIHIDSHFLFHVTPPQTETALIYDAVQLFARAITSLDRSQVILNRNITRTSILFAKEAVILHLIN